MFSDLKKVVKKIDGQLKDTKQTYDDLKHKYNYDRPPMPVPGEATGNSGGTPSGAPPPPPRPGSGTASSTAPPPAPPPAPAPAGPNDIFSAPISTQEPPSMFHRQPHHQPPVGCRHSPTDSPIQTNNFYNNLTLDDQTFPVWTQPYSLWVTKAPGRPAGMAFNHTDATQRVYGPEPEANPVQFYFNPPRIESFVFTSDGFSDKNLQVFLDNHEKMSVTANISAGGDWSRSISMPLCQGMGFVTAEYRQLRVVIFSQVGVHYLEPAGRCGPTVKYTATLFNQVTWSIYISGLDPDINLRVENGSIVSDRPSNSVVQIARGQCSAYDQAAGRYPTACHLRGEPTTSDGKKCQYRFHYSLCGSSLSNNTILWCFPHHYEVISSHLRQNDIGITLDSTVKGPMKGYLASELVMEEPNLPIDINFEPWSQISDFQGYPQKALDLISHTARQEIEQDVIGMANIDSMYTSGKILDKYAYILYVCHYILHDMDLTFNIYSKITQAIDIFAANKQIFPLAYDTSWKGIISTAEPGADFGNSNYNDHHFHYGYHLHAIALVAKVDSDINGGKWFTDNNNRVKNYAITLLRDTANPSSKDTYFPESRAFDWFHGHSFAHGIFPSGDGKDEESSSEDYHFAYSVKLMGQILNDKPMELRGNLMLAIMARSINMYMLLSDDNWIHPKQFIANKVSGILFENKLDYATYFGRGTIGNEWVHGIHMLPITPVSSYIRGPRFVHEEWVQKLLMIIDRIPDGWKGVLMLNMGLMDPKGAWKWFSRDNWDPALIDNGMSRTWSLAYLAGVGGGN